MESTVLSQVGWYRDETALSRGEIGIRHSYLASLATVLDYLCDDFDPVHLMGASAFAFRIWINQIFCPSAMSVFDWGALCPEAVEQYGRQCRHWVSYSHDSDADSDDRRNAHQAIIHSLNVGIPVVCWDVHDTEWGVLVGYSDSDQSFYTLDHHGKPRELPFERLGRNGVNLLSVIVPGEPNERSPNDVTRRALRAAVAHADQKEHLDRPEYQDGLPAYGLWATMCERWALIIDAGRPERLSNDVPVFASYYADHYWSARSYAREYLTRLAVDNPSLVGPAQQYSRVAELLAGVSRFFSSQQVLSNSADLRGVVDALRSVALDEKRAINSLRSYLGFSAR